MRRGFLVPVAMVLICLAVASSVGAVPAAVLTNTGQVITGALDGLSSVLRLNRPADQPFVGPDKQFDVPLEAIRQITFDFPRVIVETIAGTLIGPYSAFAGIDELLSLDTNSGTIDLATTALRAIALNGNSFRQVPREWMPNEFLVDPDVFRTRAMALAQSDNGSQPAVPQTAPLPDGDVKDTAATDEGEQNAGAIPLWAVLAVAGLVVGFLLVSSNSGS